MICHYCSSDNKAIRETYFDQTCKGCVERMFKLCYSKPKQHKSLWARFMSYAMGEN